MRRFCIACLFCLAALASVPASAGDGGSPRTGSFVWEIDELRPYGVSLPHLTQGQDGWRDTLYVVNHGLERVYMTLRLYDEGGDLVFYRDTLRVPGHSRAAYSPKSFASEAVCGILTFSDDSLSVSSVHRHEGGGLASYLLPASTGPALALAFPDEVVFPTAAWRGLALMNNGPDAQTVRFELVQEGGIPATAEREIPGFSRLAVPLTDLFPNALPSVLSRASLVTARALSGEDALTGVAICGTAGDTSVAFFTAKPLPAE